MRNKAAEKVRGHHGSGGPNSGSGGHPQQLPSPIGQTSVIAHAPPAAHSDLRSDLRAEMRGDLRDIRPSYSINGILGIGAQDPNGNSVGKRKRDEGESGSGLLEVTLS